jgi:hypothetical protein
MPDGLSPELQAMVQVESALSALEATERSRVIQWAQAKFRSTGSGTNRGTPDTVVELERSAGGHDLGSDDLPAFYDAAHPESDAEKALVCTYWMQFRKGAADVDSQAVNTELKHLGQGIGNITRAFEALKSQRPALIVQTRKEGSTKQARKKFKLTTEGKRAVERMLQGPAD